MAQTLAQLIKGVNLASAPANSFTIDSSGRCGIGTASVNFGAIDHGLHIYGSGAQEGIRLETTNGSGGILEIYAENGGNTLDTRGSGYIRFNSVGTEWGRWDSSGRLLVGTSTSRGNGSLLQVVDDAANNPAQFFCSPNNAEGPNVFLLKARGGSTGSPTVVSSGDTLGRLRFSGYDGSTYQEAASIVALVDGTPGANDMPGRLVFSTTADGASSPVEKMRISSFGEILTYTLATGTNIVFSNNNAAGTSYPFIDGRYSATAVGNGTLSFRVWNNGNVQNTNNSYTAISDIKLKENIIDANSQWDDIKALQVRNYNFKEGQTHRQIGLIAQEVESISPGLVYETPDRDEEGNDLGTVTKSVNYSVLYMKAVKALQEAMERIEQLEAKVAALESA